MRGKVIASSLLVLSLNIYAAPLHTVDFETANNGYTPSVEWTDTISGSISDYFMRSVNLQTTGMVDFSNIEGSYFWAIEDTDNLPSVPHITTSSINISGYTSFTATVAVAVDDAGSSSYAPDINYINFEYSIDGGPFTKFGALLVNTASWQLLKDINVDGIGDEASGITSAFTDVSFSFQGTGNQLQFRISALVGGSDETAIDNIRITGSTLEPEPVKTVEAEIHTAVEIDWLSAPGKTYQVQYSTDLVSSNWYDLGSTVPGDGSSKFIFDSIKNSSNRYYRVIEQ